MADYVLWFDGLGMNDVDRVGGKNASLGEMISHLSGMGVSVPNGFATTADAFREFLDQSGLNDRIQTILSALDVSDVKALAKAGADIRRWVVETPFQPALEAAIKEAFIQLQDGNENLSVAVRSSATAEDLPDASFAGQQETMLNVRGYEQVMLAIKEVFASLFNDRAISYRVHQGFEHAEVALSAGIQRMVRSETGSSGVMFTLDTESGFRDAVFITSSYGLGETVVQGSVNPDEFYVYKPSLKAGKTSILRRNLGSKMIKMVYSSQPNQLVDTIDVSEADRQQFSINDSEAEELAKQALIIEDHYGRPMDIEWAKDGDDKQIYIVQARPETVKSQESGNAVERFKLNETGTVLCEGRSIGQRIGKGVVRIVDGIDQMDQVREGDILVTDMTDPDWEPVMKLASAIVTNRGGRTCHAAIIARELGIAAVVGCGDATHKLSTGMPVTVSCAEGDAGYVYAGELDYTQSEDSVGEMPELPIKIMMNVGNPDRAMSFSTLPNKGVGLARLEFIINRMVGVHPKALLDFDNLDAELKATVTRQIAGYASPADYFVEKVVEGVSTIAASFAPETVIVRMSDFKSNEYAHLIGGTQYEPEEENPMIGYRGASRYISESFRECFALECKALRKAREEMGLENIQIMIPFVRTVDEARQVTELLAEYGLARGEKGLKLIMMCELPSNALLADQFLEYFDGFSIGSNDLTQLTLGLDRDSGLIAHLFDERNEAIKMLLSMAIKACKKANKYVGICGQGPSDHIDFALWLMDQGIDSISLNPDSVIDTWMHLAKHQKL
ncbi:MAG: pyruvate,water dikinase [Candidatus Endobugula sp.]|jgi:pyruvate,water dikinase